MHHPIVGAPNARRTPLTPLTAHLTPHTSHLTPHRSPLTAHRIPLTAAPPPSTHQVWEAVDEVVIKTAIASISTMNEGLRSYLPSAARCQPNTQCFQLFGFDVMLDSTGRPWLLEVRARPRPKAVRGGGRAAAATRARHTPPS